VGTWAMVKVVLGAELWGLEMSPQDSCCLPTSQHPRNEKKSWQLHFCSCAAVGLSWIPVTVSDNGFELLLAQVR